MIDDRGGRRNDGLTTGKLARRLDLAHGPGCSGCSGCAVALFRLHLGRCVQFAQQLAHTRHCCWIELVRALRVHGDTHPT